MRTKGFTLIELLAVIIILGVLAAVVMPSVFNMTKKARDDAYSVLVDSFESNAELYATRHKDEIESDLDQYNYATFTLNDLISEGLLKSSTLKDPRTDDDISSDKKIIVTRETDRSLSVCYEDRVCYIPTLLVNELTKTGNVVGGVTEGLHYDSDKKFYYYRGANPNNWIEFDNYLWRIVKINTDGTVKLVYEGPKDKPISMQTGTVGSRTFNDNNTNVFSSTTSLSAYLESFYNTNVLENNKSKIQPTTWCNSKIAYDSNGTEKATFLSNDCNSKTTSLHVGLITGSEYLYASLDQYCLGAYRTMGDNGNSCKNKNYLYKSGYNYWSTTSDNTSTNVWTIKNTGSLGAPAAANTTADVRPVINLIGSIIIDRGNGTYDNPYTIKDIVNVDKEKPVITLSGQSTVSVNVNGSYIDAGATATDNVDGNLTNNITTISNVNTAIPGTYTVTYTVQDKSGNYAMPVIRTVNVFKYEYTFNYTGAPQTFTPPQTGTYKIELWGAQGGDFDNFLGGRGGYTSGQVTLTKNTPLYVNVGGAPSNNDNGGYNGGGWLNPGQSAFGRAGGGGTDVRLSPVKKYRYVRDYINNSTANAENHWIEIMVYEVNGNNIALNKTVTGNNLQRGNLITDGNYTTGITGFDGYGYIIGTTSAQYVEIDLGAEYEISMVQIWHFYLDGRTYYETKTELYSADRTAVETLNNYSVTGTYVETIDGRTYYGTSTKSRIMVAGGGGGANYRNVAPACGYGQGAGGYGGGLTAGTGESTGHTNAGCTYGWGTGTGGTQTSGGTNISYNADGSVKSSIVTGHFGYASPASAQSGGGGGYYAGGSSGHGGGGGGSSFISGYSGCNAVNASGIHTGQANHYSGYTFTNSQMTAGNVSMPKPIGGTEVGHSGNGYARITFIQ